MGSLHHIIDLILKLTNKCTELARMRNVRMQSFLADHVDPLLRDVDTLHSEYLSLFSTARNNLAKATNPRLQLQSIGDEFKKYSANAISLRLCILARTAVHGNESLAKHLVDAITTYLKATSAWQSNIAPTAAAFKTGYTPKIEYYSLYSNNEQVVASPSQEKTTPSSNSERVTPPGHFEIELPTSEKLHIYAMNVSQTIGDQYLNKTIINPREDTESIRRDCIKQLDDLIASLNVKYQCVQAAYQKLRKELLP